MSYQPARPASPTLEREIYTVSRLNREARALLENAFALLWIEGEISNLSQPGSGHLYFCLKDGQAQVRCALFRGNQRGMMCRPRDGMHALVRARVGLYEGRGEFQLVIEHIEEAGEGRLRREFEALKQRLAVEGLFDIAHKRRLPGLPRRIGVITSPTGAAVRDIVTTLKRRFPAIPLLIYPIPVQGDGAAEKIAGALKLVSARGECDALILARGGGSLEDLWAFNEEAVARAIFACEVPVITGIGHEVDVTIADLVADVRAPTPTAAAELVSPNQGEWQARFAHYDERLLKLAKRALTEAQQRVDWLSARLVSPQDRLEMSRERLQTLTRRLRLAQATSLAQQTHRVAAMRARVLQGSPKARLAAHGLRVQQTQHGLLGAMRWMLQARQARFERATQTLNALSPLATLGRGYAIVRDVTGEIVRDSRTVQIHERLEAKFASGSALLRVESTSDD